MSVPSSFAASGFQSARQVLAEVGENGEGRNCVAQPMSPRTGDKRKICNLTDSIDDVERAERANASPENSPGAPTSRRPSDRVSQPSQAAGSAWTTAARLEISTSREAPIDGSPTPRPVLARQYHPPAAIAAGPELSAQQAEVLSRVLAGESIFFTGSAGTGKSVLLRAIIQAFREKEGVSDPEYSRLGVTASTGVSAINIGGTTLHSWAGIRLGTGPKKELADIVMRYQAARDRWTKSSALIIDEISMIDGKLFNKLDYIGRTVRNCNKPFGGLQLILCGDFYQLPPVSKSGDDPAAYAFESPVWGQIFRAQNMVCLKQVFRQKDSGFIRILNEMREGRITGVDLRRMQALDRDPAFPDEVPPVELYPTKNEADCLNSSKLRAILKACHTYDADDQAGLSPNGRRMSPDETQKALDTHTLFVPQLQLKVAAVVMLLNNRTNRGLCNGSTGKVVDFMTIQEADAKGIQHIGMCASRYTVFPVVEFIPGKYVTVPTPKQVLVPCFDVSVTNPNGTMIAKRVQVPLILAWGLTVHKAQGLSLDRVKVDLAKTFENGQAYVALSRATSMEGLQILNLDEHKLKVSIEVLRWSSRFEDEEGS